ncbi:MAG: restriction endonuclease subunit S, partial [Oscillospiraceae bacterium]
MEYTLRSLGSFSEMKYGKMPNKKMSSDKGKYPIFSGYRVVGYCDECNIGEQQLVVVARGVGGTGDVKLSPGACFLTNLSIAVLVDESVALKKYLYYYFLKNNLRYLDSGSAQSQITIGDLKNVEVPLPSIETQKKVVSILDVIDEKINNNVAINDNLADLLQTIYQDRFGNDILAVNQGVLSDICSYSRDKVAVSELNVSTYFSTENMLSEKAGSTEATSLPTTSQTTACHKGDTLISNIRPYFKKIVYCEGNCGCSTDVLCFTPSQPRYSTYLFSTLYADKFFAFMVAGSKGTKMPRGD